MCETFALNVGLGSSTLDLGYSCLIISVYYQLCYLVLLVNTPQTVDCLVVFLHHFHPSPKILALNSELNMGRSTEQKPVDPDKP